MAALEATVEGFEHYSHQQWHDLNNKLQPLFLLPERLTRDIAKIQGSFDGRINSVSRDIEQSITKAIEKAIGPVYRDVADLKSEVEDLKQFKIQATAAKGVVGTILNSPLLAWLLALAVAGWTLIKGGGVK